MAGSPPDPRFFAALKDRRAGDTASARERLEAILAEDPDHADALEVLGMILSEDGELERAIALTARLAELVPDSIMAHANISRFYMLKGKPWRDAAVAMGWEDLPPGPPTERDVDERTVDELEQALEQDGDDTTLMATLVTKLTSAGEHARALEVAERLHAADPESVDAKSGMWTALKGIAEEWQGKARVLGWKEEVGRKAAAAGDQSSGLGETVDPKTVEKQEAAVSERPDDPLARMALARSYQKLGMPAKAISHLRKALDLDDSLSTVYLELGKCLEGADMKQDALAVYEQGMPLAQRKGDLMPLNQMASRHEALKKELAG